MMNKQKLTFLKPDGGGAFPIFIKKTSVVITLIL